MKKLYLLSEPCFPKEKGDVIGLFLKQNKTNEFFLDTLDTIANHLSQFQIINNEIDNLYWSEKYQTRIFSMEVSSILGDRYRGIVIKQLRNFKHTYEIRINQEYYKHRILFQFNHVKESGTLEEEFFILSYAFSKNNGEDKTDRLSSSNDSIKEDIIDKGNKRTHINHWLGGEWNEF